MADLLPINSEFDYKADSWQYKLKIFQKDTNKEEIINIVYNTKDTTYDKINKEKKITLSSKKANITSTIFEPNINESNYPYWVQKKGEHIIITANPNDIKVPHLDKVTYYTSIGLPCDPLDPDDPNLPCPPDFDPRLIDPKWNSVDGVPVEGGSYINQVITSTPSSYRTCIIDHPELVNEQLFIFQQGTDDKTPDEILWKKYFTFTHKKGMKDPQIMCKVKVPKAEGVDIRIEAKLYPEINLENKEYIKMWWWYFDEGERGNYVTNHWPNPEDKTSFYYGTENKNLAKREYTWHLFSKAEPELVDTDYTISGYIGFTLPKDFDFNTI